MEESGQRENIPQAEPEKPVNKLAVAAFIVAFVALVCAVFTLRVFLGSIELMGTIDDMAKDPEGGAGGAVIATFGLVPLIAVWLVLGFVGTSMALVSVGLGAGAVSVRNGAPGFSSGRFAGRQIFSRRGSSVSKPR